MRSALYPVLFSDPMSQWARDAVHAWDFLKDKARWNRGRVGSLANTPGWSYTRADAQTAYAQNAAGVLIPFSTGQLRRTDKGVLIEGARTNLCLQSQTFDNASWTKTNGAITADAIAAPDGTLTADLFTVSSTTFTSLYQSLGAVASTTCTATVYVQAGNIVNATSSFILYDTTAAGNVVNGTLTWATMSMSGTGASIERLGSTNWYRVTLSTSSWVNGNSARVYLSAAGASMTVASSWYIWGAQLEAASFPSSYIPTTTASATRAADVLTVPVSGIDYPLTLFAQFSRVVDTGGAECVFGANASSNERIDMRVSNVDLFQPLQVDGGSSVASPAVSGALAIGTVYKAAARFGLDSVQACRSGTLATEDTSATVPDAPTTITFGMRNSGSDPSFGYLRRAAIWSRALTDAELQALTL